MVLVSKDCSIIKGVKSAVVFPDALGVVFDKKYGGILSESKINLLRDFDKYFFFEHESFLVRKLRSADDLREFYNGICDLGMRIDSIFHFGDGFEVQAEEVSANEDSMSLDKFKDIISQMHSLKGMSKYRNGCLVSVIDKKAAFSLMGKRFLFFSIYKNYIEFIEHNSGSLLDDLILYSDCIHGVDYNKELFGENVNVFFKEDSSSLFSSLGAVMQTNSLGHLFFKASLNSGKMVFKIN